MKAYVWIVEVYLNGVWTPDILNQTTREDARSVQKQFYGVKTRVRKYVRDN